MKIIHSIKARNLLSAAILSVGLSLASSVFGQTVSYLIDPDGTAIQIGSLDGAGGTEASAINDNGQVVGRSWRTGSAYHAFITGPNGAGIMALFGNTSMNSSATGINNAGEVVGSFEVTVADPYHPPIGPTGSGFVTNEHAFITGPNGTGMTDLSPPSYYAYTSASAINDSGQVAIIADYDIFSHAPYSHTNGLITGPHGAGMTDLGQLAEDKIANFTEPFGINNAGQVVGWSETAEGATAHAFITGPNGIGMVDLGTLGQQDLSMAVGINETGQVTGSSWSTTGGVTHAFITGANGIGMTDLGALGGSGSNSLAYDINDAGQVVGWSNTSSSMHAFVTGPNGAGMTDLNSLAHLPAGVTLTKAVGINNLGQVVAVGYAVGAIPEPASYTLMLAGLALVGLVVTKKQAV